MKKWATPEPPTTSPWNSTRYKTSTWATPTTAYILLPYAGPEITDWLIEEARQIATPGGVGDQWVAHVNEEVSILSRTVPGVRTLEPEDFRRRAFFSISWEKFDYIGHMTFGGEWPTHRFEFEDSQRRQGDPEYEFPYRPFNDPDRKSVV